MMKWSYRKSSPARDNADSARPRRLRRKERALWALAVSLLLLAVFCCGRSRAQDANFNVTATGMDGESAGYTPLYLDIFNPRQQTLQILITGSNYRSLTFRFARKVSLGDTATVRLEIPLPANGNTYNIEVKQQNGEVERTSLYSHSLSRSRSSGIDNIYTVNAYKLAEITDQINNNNRSGGSANASSLRVENMPRCWQSYAGLQGVILLSVDTIPRLNDQQKDALGKWVRWGGGRLWIVGLNAMQAARDMGYDLRASSKGRSGNIRCFPCVTGEVWLKSDADFSKWTDSSIALNKSIVSQMRTAETSSFRSRGLLEGLGLISAPVIMTILVVLGILLGPVNFLYIRRARSPLLFFVTTPVLALLGSLAVFGYSAFSEGWVAKYKETALLLHESGTERAAMYHARGIYSGLATRELTYPAEALLYPFRKSAIDNQELSTDLNDGIRLTGGWITPRTPSGVLSVTPVTARMGVELTRENGKIYALNTLSHTVRTLGVYLPGGMQATELQVKPGERRELTPVANNEAAGMLRVRLNNHFSDLSAGDLGVIAECEGLPYLDDNGLNGSKVDGAYFYAATGGALLTALRDEIREERKKSAAKPEAGQAAGKEASDE